MLTTILLTLAYLALVVLVVFSFWWVFRRPKQPKSVPPSNETVLKDQMAQILPEFRKFGWVANGALNIESNVGYLRVHMHRHYHIIEITIHLKGGFQVRQVL